MSNYVFHFLSSFEGTVTDAEEIGLPRGSTRITINNDHSTDPMLLSFDGEEQRMTIRAGEMCTFNVESQNMNISGLGSSIPYRIWLFT